MIRKINHKGIYCDNCNMRVANYQLKTVSDNISTPKHDVALYYICLDCIASIPEISLWKEAYKEKHLDKRNISYEGDW